MHIGNVVRKTKAPRVRKVRRPVQLLEAAPALIPLPPDWPAPKKAAVPLVRDRDRR